MLGSLIQGGLGYAAQKQANETNLRIARETNEANRQLAQYEWNRNLEMWNLQNQYNSPAAQMQRFKQAGLNPNLIYGQGNAGNATTLPRYSAPTMQPVTVQPEVFRLNGALDVMSKYLDLQIKSAQEQQIRQQTSNMWYQQHELWPTQNNLWSSQRDYWANNANRIFELLPFEKRNYNSLINTRADNVYLSRLRYELDKQRFMYGLQLQQDRFAFDKQVWKDRYDLMKDRFTLDSRNSLYPRAIQKKQYEFFRDYGVMPNTQLGAELGFFSKLYDNPISAYSNWFIGKGVVNTLGNLLGGGSFRRGRPKRGYQGYNTTTSLNY